MAHQWSLFFTIFLFAGTHAVVVQNKQGGYYHGFDSLRHLFTFGDSYTRTGFNISTGPLPSPSNPLGSPDDLPWWGETSANGPNWIDYLTTKYNQSFLETFNFGYSGATVDSDILDNSAYDIVRQVREEFLPNCSNGTIPGSNQTWSPSSTAFGVFIGVNDVHLSYVAENRSAIDAAEFATFADLVEELYHAGARNFFFMGVPPIQYAYRIAYHGSDYQEKAREAISLWNDDVKSLATNLTQKHHDSTVFYLDTYDLWMKVMEDPTQFSETALYKNTTSYCELYEDGTPELDTFYPNCTYPVNEYLWLNDLHPTYPMHELMARKLAETLAA